MHASWVVVPAVLALAVAGAPAPASGAVAVDAERVVVTSASGARASVTRAPFRLAFSGPRGRPVLRSVAADVRSARRLPPTRDPEPLALEREPDNVTYAPLTFEVGREVRRQWRGGSWAGNLLGSRRAGTVHAARRVLAVRREGGGARLLVSTTDRRRRLVVRITPDRAGALRLRVRPTRSAGVMTTAAAFAAAPGEAFHGLGGRHRGTDLAGAKAYGWVEQENVGASILDPLAIIAGLYRTESGDARWEPPAARELPGGPGRYLFPGGPLAAYHPQNVLYSSRGWGVLVDQDELTRWRLGNDRRDAWQIAASAAGLDLSVAVGGAADSVRAVTAIGGRHRLPPAWAHGATLWRAIQVGAQPETRATVLAKIEADLAQIEARRAPVRAYAFEGWNLLGPELTTRVIARLHALRIRAVLYLRAYVAYDELNSQPAGDVERALAEGLTVKDARGRPSSFTTAGATGYTLDMTNPRTRAWWRARIELLLSWGADGFMQDFGEHVLESDRFADGSTGRTMHNRYPVVYHRVTKEILDELEPRLGREIFWFTRAGFSGRPGSVASEMANFPGDETADWGAASGLASLAPDMLNRAVGGAFGYTTDIGGYLDVLNPPADEELWTRWHEWAALTPFFRVHNSQRTGTRMPWSFGERGYERWAALARLHERAVPLIRRLWREGRRTGLPPTRPLWLGAPGERRLDGASQEWMLGEDVLVAPVVRRGATTRAVPLPRGCWVDQGTGRRLRGGRTVTVPAPLGLPPHLFRCGTRPF